MYNKTIIIAQTFEVITSFNITKTLLHNISVHLINFTKEMHPVFINNMVKVKTTTVILNLFNRFLNMHTKYSPEYIVPTNTIFSQLTI